MPDPRILERIGAWEADGLIDAADPDCGRQSPTPSPEPAPAGVPPFPVELPRTGGKPAVARN